LVCFILIVSCAFAKKKLKQKIGSRNKFFIKINIEKFD
jgi:hypothetical protein